jgi:hypothetical protein
VSGTVRDVVIVGAPRSGTSMLAGLFVDAGHHAGRRLIPPTPSNPAGFHEDLDVNAANDDLLGALDHASWPGTMAPARRLRWLGAYDGWVRGPAPVDVVAPLVPGRPFVLKDPRFCYTLPAWGEALGDVVVVVIVRHPAEVAASIRSMREREPETFEGFDVTDAHLEAMWTAMHRAVLGWCDVAAPGPVVFVDCDDVRSGAALPRLAEVSGVDLLARTVQPGLHRERPARLDPDGDQGELLALLRERIGS